VIITGGENIYPVEIEDFLQGHPKIHDVAVIGLPSLRLGEIATAVIQVKPDQTLTKDEINDFCNKIPDPGGSFSARCPATPPER
ncbi:MAG: long-chain fatty acid--CoA ligase, partial [Deltaproteobacteria bacterium]|nr:long-chain fatty acid--CoA ligase [Deltaproteobacteria bacterium]